MDNTVFTVYCYGTNYRERSSLKHCVFLLSQFPWVRILGAAQGLTQLRLRDQLGGVPFWTWGSPPSCGAVGSIQFLAGEGTRSPCCQGPLSAPSGCPSSSPRGPSQTLSTRQLRPSRPAGESPTRGLSFKAIYLIESGLPRIMSLLTNSKSLIWAINRICKVPLPLLHNVT